MYSESNLLKLDAAYPLVDRTYEDTLLKLAFLAATLTNEDAKEYVLQGVGRRLRILRCCIHNVFAMFPPTQEHVLTDDDAAQLCIPVHAFIINTAGIADNLAWTFAKEKNSALKNTEVGLHLSKTKDLLTPEFRHYLEAEPIASWSKRYLKEYRDSLAHRIPLYIPPGQSPDGKRFPLPIFRGSVKSDQVMMLHPQLLADFNTVAEIVEKFIKFEFPVAANLDQAVAAM